MDLNEITKILAEESGIHICPVCGTPFTPYHGRQKTCGTEECKRKWHNKYVQDRVKRLKAENLDAWRRYHAKANRKYRHKQKQIQERETELKQLQERWDKQAEFDRKISEYGHEYGKRSAEKLLATIPKIDVNLGGKNDNVHDKDKRGRSREPFGRK